MHRSIRAVHVLVLNVCLGVLTFGAIIYFVEQGEYNVDSQDYERPGGWEFNYTIGAYVQIMEHSPFESIPHSFWWAFVTQTTVGYGDVAPTTVSGKVVAGCAMIWSLCVLALPVGVIGANFGTVWAEYDNEKRAELDLRASEREMVRKTVMSVDPLCMSRGVLIEVFHDSHMSTTANDIFIGEAELDLEFDSSRVVQRSLRLPLKCNPEKSHRTISGNLCISYSWTPSLPDGKGDQCVLLEGTLEILVTSAEGLVAVDWKGSGLSDPYVLLTVWPNSPSAVDGTISPQILRSRTINDNPVPLWDQRFVMQYRWSEDGVRAKRETDRLSSDYSPGGTRTTTPTESLTAGRDSPVHVAPVVTSQQQDKLLLNELQADVVDLRKNVLPDVRSEMDSIHHGVQTILALLGMPSVSCVGEASTGDASSTASDACSIGRLPGVDDTCTSSSVDGSNREESRAHIFSVGVGASSLASGASEELTACCDGCDVLPGVVPSDESDVLPVHVPCRGVTAPPV